MYLNKINYKLCVLLFGLCGVAFAQNESEIIGVNESDVHVRDGSYYVNLENGLANVSLKLENGKAWQETYGLTVNGGYNFNKYWAAEAGYTWFAPVNRNFPNDDVVYRSSINQSFADVAAKFTYPISPFFNVGLKGGLGMGISHGNGSRQPLIDGYNGALTVSPALYMGLSAAIRVHKNTDILIDEYGILPFGGANWGGVSILSIGLGYTFN